jgi:hypothetical protein
LPSSFNSVVFFHFPPSLGRRWACQRAFPSSPLPDLRRHNFDLQISFPQAIRVPGQERSLVDVDIMGLSSGSRTGVVNGASPSLLSSPSRRSPRTSLTNSSKPLSPSVSVSSSDSDTSSHKQRVLFDSASRRASFEAIAPEIVVCTEKMDTTAMEVTPTTDTPRGEEQAAAYVCSLVVFFSHSTIHYHPSLACTLPVSPSHALPLRAIPTPA